MEVKTIALVLILSASFAVGAKRNQDNIVSLARTFSVFSQVTFNFQEALIEAAGYESEVHYAETQDGYLLKVHRIKVKTTSAVPRKGPVFILHGLLATAADYLMTGAEKALREFRFHSRTNFYLKCILSLSALKQRLRRMARQRQGK